MASIAPCSRLHACSAALNSASPLARQAPPSPTSAPLSAAIPAREEREELAGARVGVGKEAGKEARIGAEVGAEAEAGAGVGPEVEATPQGDAFGAARADGRGKGVGTLVRGGAKAPDTAPAGGGSVVVVAETASVGAWVPALDPTDDSTCCIIPGSVADKTAARAAVSRDDAWSGLLGPPSAPPLGPSLASATVATIWLTRVAMVAGSWAVRAAISDVSARAGLLCSCAQAVGGISGFSGYSERASGQAVSRHQAISGQTVGGQ